MSDAETVQTKLDTDSTDQTTVETRNDGDEERCPTCGNWYKRLTSHWNHGSCSRPPISDYQWELMKGMMLGDGSVNRSKDTNPRVEFYNTNKTFLEWLSKELRWICGNVRMKRTAVGQARKTRKHFDTDTQPEDCVDYYVCHTRRLPVFEEFESWYSTGEIVFPRDLSVSATTLLTWYVSDGGLNQRKSGTARVRLASVKESNRPDAIINALEEHDFTVGQSDERFKLSSGDTEDFFELIGTKPVPGFAYKWAWRDYDCYHRLQDFGREVHHTQTLDPDS